jgi:hypothetical protein
VAHALGLGHRVGADDLLSGPLVQHAQRHQHQPFVGDDGFFRLRREARHEAIAALERSRQLGELDSREIQYLIEPLQGEVLAREHALHARFAHADGPRHGGVGHAQRLELFLECVDQGCACAHGLIPPVPRKVSPGATPGQSRRHFARRAFL